MLTIFSTLFFQTSSPRALYCFVIGVVIAVAVNGIESRNVTEEEKKKEDEEGREKLKRGNFQYGGDKRSLKF
jgi:hypothetical protein